LLGEIKEDKGLQSKIRDQRKQHTEMEHKINTNAINPFTPTHPAPSRGRVRVGVM
jgi:hypothetical protein